MNLKWTKDKPTIPGWYWKREHGMTGVETNVVKVRTYAGRMCIINWEIPNNAEWAGPIPEPEE